MTTPSRTRSERKHAAILQAARTAFLRDGFGGASMDVIAADSAVSKQTVYAHFGSKETLYTHAVAELTEDIARQLPGPPAVEGDPEAAADWLLDFAVRLMRGVLTPDVVQLRRLVVAEADRFPEIARAFHDHGVQRSIENLTAAVDAFASDGILEVDDAAAAAADFNWLVLATPVNQAMMLGVSSMPTPAGQRNHARRAVSVFFAAYGAPR